MLYTRSPCFSRYKIVDDLKCSDPGSLVLASVVTEVVADRTIAEHQCETKCVKGCTGPYCYCDGSRERSRWQLLLSAGSDSGIPGLYHFWL